MTDHIERLRGLLARATPGPWSENYLYSVLRYGRKNLDETGPEDGDEKLIVAMHAALPALLAVAEAAREATRGIERCERYDAIGDDRLEKLEKLAELVANLEKLQ